MSLSSSVTLALIVLAMCPAASAERRSSKLVWEMPTPGQLPMAMVCDRDNEHLFVALKSGGVAILDIRRRKTTRQVAVILKRQLGDLDAMHLTRKGDLLFVALGDLFARKCHAGLAIVDIANPSRPALLSLWKSPGEM